MQMEGTLPTKAAAFALVTRPDGAVLCTVEGPADAPRVGLPGGKWEPGADGPSWARLLAREYAEEVGGALPPARRAGYLEWGGARYRVRFVVLELDEEVAAAVPVGPSADPRGSVRDVRWLQPGDMPAAGQLRPHVNAALRVLASSALLAREVAQKPPPPGDGL